MLTRNRREPGQSSCLVGPPSLEREKLSQTPALGMKALDHTLWPVLGRAQDGLQVLGQGADGRLDVQLGLLQRLLCHRKLVALCPHLQGQRWSGESGFVS